MATAWQTLGPFFPPALLRGGDNDLTRRAADAPAARGTAIELVGTVRQEGGTPVPGALLEIWQADAGGVYAHPADPRREEADPHFRFFGRYLTGADGTYLFRTVKPGPVPFEGNRWQAPHVVLAVFAAGLLRRLVTRIYFADEPANARDPVLESIGDAAARATLLAEPCEGAAPRYRFDVRLRGAGETLFFTD